MATVKPLPAELAAGSFTIGEGRLGGISPWRARAKGIHVPSRGIRVPAGKEQSLLERARPYTRLGTPDTVSFYSAAFIHVFKLPPAAANAHSTPSAGLLDLAGTGTLTLEDLVVFVDDLVCEHVRYQHPRTARVALGSTLRAGRNVAPRPARSGQIRADSGRGSALICPQLARGRKNAPGSAASAGPGALFAEGKRFELLVRGYRTLVFKTSSIGRSDNLP